MIKLNLGCGNDIRKGYQNVDLRGWKGTIQEDMSNYLLELDDESVEEVLMYNSLECLPHGVEKNESCLFHTDIMPTALEVLHQIKRVLSPNGIVRLKVRNAGKVLDKLVEYNMRELNYYLLGTFDGCIHHGFHSMWTPVTLTKLAQEVGFKVEKVEEQNIDILMDLRKK